MPAVEPRRRRRAVRRVLPAPGPSHGRVAARPAGAHRPVAGLHRARRGRVAGRGGLAVRVPTWTGRRSTSRRRSADVSTQLGRATAKVHCVSDKDTDDTSLVDFQTEDAIVRGARRPTSDGFVADIVEFGIDYGGGRPRGPPTLRRRVPYGAHSGSGGGGVRPTLRTWRPRRARMCSDGRCACSPGGQVLGGVGVGSGIAVGGLIAEDVSNTSPCRSPTCSTRLRIASSRRRTRRRRSSSSTSSTRSAAPAGAAARSAATTSVSRRSTRSSPRWTASTRTWA